MHLLIDVHFPDVKEQQGSGSKLEAALDLVWCDCISPIASRAIGYLRPELLETLEG